MQSALMATSPPVRHIIDDVAAEMVACVDASAAAVTDAIHENIDDLADDLYLATRQSTRANCGLITTLVAEGAEPTCFAAPEEALAYARRYVHEGLSPECLTRVYQRGRQAYSGLWLERLGARAGDADELTEAMGYVSDWLFAYIEAINEPLYEAYTAERERCNRDASALRVEQVRAILGGAPVNAAEASGRLRYRLDVKHVGFVIAASASPEDDILARQRDMACFATELVETSGARSSLCLPLGRYYAGWLTVAEPPAPADLPQPPSGLRLAFGRLGRGLDGFRRTHHEARLALRVASLTARPGATSTSFDAVALDALMTQDLDEARRFVMHEIGPLIEESDTHRRLAATLEVYLHEGSSYVRTARRLGIHKNTVAYRVRRAEQLLGRSAGERQLELRAALRLMRVLRSDATA